MAMKQKLWMEEEEDEAEMKTCRVRGRSIPTEAKAKYSFYSQKVHPEPLSHVDGRAPD